MTTPETNASRTTSTTAPEAPQVTPSTALLHGRVALVTAGVKGIGRGITEALVRAGAAVAVTYKTDRAAAQEMVDDLTGRGYRVLALAADTTDPEQCRSLFAQVREALGAVTVLVNNAGRADFVALADVAVGDYRAAFDTNVLAPLMALQQFAAQPEADGGAVVNITTATLTDLPAGSALYTASKSALATLTVVAAKELAGRGIRVNAVAPPATRTERTRQYAGTTAEVRLVQSIPLGRMGTPADVGDAVVFLVSDAARFITADTLHVSGGQV